MREALIVTFFKDLENKFHYAILHHVEEVFSSNNDIDLIVDCNKNDLISFVSLFCNKNNGYFLSHTIDRGTLRFNLIFLDKNKSYKIELDITYNNHNLLDINVKKLLSKKYQIAVNDFQFFKIDNNHEIEYYINKKAFKNEVIDNQNDYFKKLNPNIDSIEIKLLFEKNLKKYASLKFNLQKKLQKLNLLFVRLYEKPSLTVCFLGPDGSGKSTIIEELKTKNPFVNFKYFHLKPINKKTEPAIVVNPHSKPPYSPIFSYLKLVYFIFQYNINWILNIWTIQLTPTIIVFDRYFDDIIADPKRYRYGGSIQMVKIARLFIPKPAISFVLVAESEIIQARKMEVSKEELDLQLERYYTLCVDFRYKKIEVSNSVAQITNEVILEILNKKKHAV